MPTLRAGAGPTTSRIDRVLPDPALRALEPTITAVDRLLDDGHLLENPVGEPAGHDGLARRGTPERLLASEWLLAGEEPDEFLRRYGNSELGYLRLARTAEQRTRTALVLFDTGPGQLGGPRVVHLACLVALARRAERAGVTLRWGSLQQPGRDDSFDGPAVTRLLRARTYHPTADLPLDAVVDESLIVSGAPMPGAARQLLLRQVDDGTVSAELIDRRYGTTRRAAIPLPHPDMCIRLLRDPLGHGSTGASTALGAGDGPVSNLVFAVTGTKLFARTGDGSAVVAYPVFPSPQPPGRARHYRSWQRLPITAAGRVRKAVVFATVLADGSAVEIERFGRAETPTGRYPLIGCMAGPATATGLGTFTVVDGTPTIRAAGQELVWVPGPPAGFECFPSEAQWRFDTVTIRAEGDRHVLSDGADDVPFTVPGGATLIGAAHRRDVGPCALVIAAGGRTVDALEPRTGRVVTLYAAESPLVDGTAHHSATLWAARSEAGGVVACSWATDRCVYRLGAA